MQGLLTRVFKKVEMGDIDASIEQFDAISEGMQLGMNLGKEKGDVIEATVREALRLHGNSSGTFAVLEVGAHFGDGTLRIARAIQKFKDQLEPHAHQVIVSLEANKLWAAGCLDLVQHALGYRGAGTPRASSHHGPSGPGAVEQLHFQALVTAPDATARAAKSAAAFFGAQSYSLVLLDHEHGRYLQDLRALVAAGMLRPGALVHADNAGRDQLVLKEYLDYVKGGGPFSSRLEDIRRPYRDQVAISSYNPAQEL